MNNNNPSHLKQNAARRCSNQADPSLQPPWEITGPVSRAGTLTRSSALVQPSHTSSVFGRKSELVHVFSQGKSIGLEKRDQKKATGWMFADELELTVVVEQRGHAELAAPCSIKPGV